MQLVVIESPFKATDYYSVEQHRVYLQFALQDCFKRGEAPFASHGLYVDVLDDDVLPERLQGIQAGLLWGVHCDYVVVYGDLGISSGMKEAISHWESLNKRIEWRKIDPGLFKAVLEM